MNNIEKMAQLKSTLAGLTLSKPSRDYHARQVHDRFRGANISKSEYDMFWNDAVEADVAAFDEWSEKVRLVEKAIKVVADQITVEKALTL